MEKKTYTLANLPKAGPYSHVVEAGGFLFLSGMLPVDPAQDLMIKDDIRTATALVLGNIKKALEACGSNLDKVIKVTVFLRDMAYFPEMNAVYKTFFSENPPARSCVAVAAVPGDFSLEIEAIAIT
jgi:2-iminobutanoate/2-iminopropanoate deaminase